MPTTRASRRRVSISVFTPTHRPTHLADAYRSLQAQDRADWQWVVLLNGDAHLFDRDLAGRLDTDPRVTVVHGDGAGGVGYWKRLAVEHCLGDLLVELDHDDMLTPTCLSEVAEAFRAHPWASLVYSNTVQIANDGTRCGDQWSHVYGWEYRDVPAKQLLPDTETHLADETYLECHALAPTPHNVSNIWWAPNHVRAFTRTAYDAAGGYRADLDVCDDLDLMCRLFQQGDFHQIDAPLYLQRVHPGMTQTDPDLNARIQNLSWDLYEQHLQANLLAWSARHGLAAVEIGCGNRKTPGFVGVDRYPLDGVDLVAELPDLSSFADGTVGVVRAVDVLEHVPTVDVPRLMDEIHRVLAPGGMLLSLTPSTDGRGAWQDPTHVSFWNQNSAFYWTDDAFRSFSPQTAGHTARFQASRVRTYFPSVWHEQHDIPYVQMNLIAVKSVADERNGGELNVTPSNDPKE